MTLYQSPCALTWFTFPLMRESGALVPIPSPAGRRERAVGATRYFIYLKPRALRAASFKKGLLA